MFESGSSRTWLFDVGFKTWVGVTAVIIVATFMVLVVVAFVAVAARKLSRTSQEEKQEVK